MNITTNLHGRLRNTSLLRSHGLAHADIEGTGAAGPAGVQRDADPEDAAMTLRFIVAVRDRVPLGEEAPA